MYKCTTAAIGYFQINRVILYPNSATLKKRYIQNWESDIEMYFNLSSSKDLSRHGKLQQP